MADTQMRHAGPYLKNNVYIALNPSGPNLPQGKQAVSTEHDDVVEDWDTDIEPFGGSHAMDVDDGSSSSESDDQMVSILLSTSGEKADSHDSIHPLPIRAMMLVRLGMATIRNNR